MEYEFKSLEELYKRVEPALYSKVKELRRLGFNVINEIDIWNYLVENNWKNRVNLELSDIVSEIMYADNNDLNEYVMNKIKKTRKPEEKITERGEIL